MSAPTNPQFKDAVPRKAWISFALFFIVACANLFQALSIAPRFKQLYKDFGVPPGSIIIHSSLFLVLLAFLWLAAGATVTVQARGRKAMRWNLALLAAAFGQSAITFIALLFPLIDMPVDQLGPAFPASAIATPAAVPSSSATKSNQRPQ